MALAEYFDDQMFPLYFMFHAALLSTLSWVLWKILQQIAVKHPFDDIPGPPPQSYLWGFISDLALTEVVLIS
jgi:hypothetical protein